MPIMVPFVFEINADPLSPRHIDCKFAEFCAQITDFRNKRNGNILRHSLNDSVVNSAKCNCLDILVLSLVAPLPMAITGTFCGTSQSLGN